MSCERRRGNVLHARARYHAPPTPGDCRCARGQDTTLHGGFIKIEYRNAAGNWNDVTNEILNLGIAAPSYAAGCLAQDPNPNAVIRIQRVRYDGNLMEPGGTGCGNGSQDGYDYWPLVLYDTREGNFRDGIPTGQTTMFLAGVRHYVELDVNNFRRWVQGSIGTSGNSVLDQNGYVVYFSDRRGNRDFAGNETGEFGFEDFVNPASGSGTPNGALDTGEDVNANGSLDIYGGTPGVVGQAPLDATATPTTLVDRDVARVNRAIFFRRALKVRNGALGNIPMPGLTITAENPVYLEGDFNASGPSGGFVEPNAATSIMADAVSFLSVDWQDDISLDNPHNRNNRNNRNNRDADTTWYRVAIVAGKGLAFPRPAGTPNDYGTDGGTHNFLRMLERWSGETLNYRGAMITFYDNRQALGTNKCCSNVYSPPTRAFEFDVDFLDPKPAPAGDPDVPRRQRHGLYAQDPTGHVAGERRPEGVVSLQP